MTIFKGPKERQADERRVKDSGPSANPAWWTPVRVEVMRALMRRSEIHVRMASKGPRSDRWRPHAIFMKTKHLFEGGPAQVLDGSKSRPNPILTQQNAGPAIRNLTDWGYLRRAPTTVAQVEFTIKGWAWLAAEGHIEPAWLELIFERHDADRAKAWELYRKIRASRKLHNLSIQYAGGLQEKAVADIMENDDMADLPYEPPVDGGPGDPSNEMPSEHELPGLPQFAPEVEDSLRDRVLDGDMVVRTRLQLARTLHFNTIGALSKIEPREIDGAISRHFSSEEVLRADLEMVRDQRQGPRDSYYSRELVNRMSEAGEFKSRSLADFTHGGLSGVHGQDRIAAALQARELRDAGVARGLPKETTLGDVQDRIDSESITGIAGRMMDGGKPYGRDEALADVISHGEVWRTALTHMRDNAAPATEDTDDVGYWQHQLNVVDRILLALDIAMEPTPAPVTPEEIEAERARAQADDDNTPMVDWIDRQLKQHEYDGWVPAGMAGQIARGAVFRHMRQNPSGVQIVGEGNITQYDGAALHVRRNISALNGRPARLALTIDSDYDPLDVADIEEWFRRLAEGRGRNYTYPAGANVDHEVVGELEHIRVRSINPIWMVGMSIGGGLVALLLFTIIHNIIPLL